MGVLAAMVAAVQLAAQARHIYTYTGWPIKNGTGYFPQYVDAITGINVWGNFS